MAIVGVTAVLFGGFFCWQMNTFEFYRAPEKAFIAQLKAQTANIAPSKSAFLPQTIEAAAETLFYLDKPGLSTIIKDVNELKGFLASRLPRALISLRKGLPEGLEEQLKKLTTENTEINNKVVQVIEEQAQKWESQGELGKKRIAWILSEPVTVTLTTEHTENTGNKKVKKVTEE